mgnify:CR=1 FL=1
MPSLIVLFIYTPSVKGLTSCWLNIALPYLFGILATSDTNGNQDSLDLDNGNIVVEFGGQKWNAVYLSKATSADSDTNVR